jgi:acetyltransferase-like isoleucine patch superfamily enzyme
LRFVKLLIDVGIAALPSILKIPVYRWLYGHQIGKGVRIGLSPFLGVGRCTIGDDVRIGSFNLFTGVKELTIGDHTRIGFLNLVRGGDRVSMGSYTTILRFNTFNAIVDGDFVTPVESTLDLGTGVFVASGHWLDFSAGIRIGEHSIIGGRHSSFWTHNRQRGRSIEIGHHTYLGSEIRVAPGARIPSLSIVALGSVVVGWLSPEQSLIAGNPAIVLRGLSDEERPLVSRATRNDIPQELAFTLLPEDWRA